MSRECTSHRVNAARTIAERAMVTIEFYACGPQ